MDSFDGHYMKQLPKAFKGLPSNLRIQLPDKGNPSRFFTQIVCVEIPVYKASIHYFIIKLFFVLTNYHTGRSVSLFERKTL